MYIIRVIINTFYVLSIVLFLLFITLCPLHSQEVRNNLKSHTLNIGLGAGLVLAQPASDEMYTLPSYSSCLFSEIILLEYLAPQLRFGYSNAKFDNPWATIYHDYINIDLLLKLCSNNIFFPELSLYFIGGIGNNLSLSANFVQKKINYSSSEEKTYKYSENFTDYSMDIITGLGIIYNLKDNLIFLELSVRNGIQKQLKETDNPLFKAKSARLQTFNIFIGYQFPIFGVK